MNKPKIFISSTVYDFADMRSSLRYWLTELGFNVQLSERPNFDKDSSKNSFESCLETVKECDYFILLLGSRVGGWFDEEKTISITRKEYQTAYESLVSKGGNVQKIFTFIRQNVWDVRDDRKALEKLLNKIYKHDYSKLAEYDLSKFESKFLNDDASHIMSFIDEVTRRDEMAGYENPPNNWVHHFEGFQDIIDAIKTELKLSFNISARGMKQNVKLALVGNLREIFRRDNGELVPFYKNFQPIHELLLNNNLSNTQANGMKIHSAGEFFDYCKSKATKLNTFAFEDAVSSSAFLRYDSISDEIVSTNFHRALLEMLDAIRKVKMITPKAVLVRTGTEMHMPSGTGVNISRTTTPPKIHYDRVAFYQYKVIYERFIDIVDISRYMLSIIENPSKSLEYPDLFSEKMDVTKPSESEVLQLLRGGV